MAGTASKIMWLLTPHDHFWKTVPASSSSLISSSLEQVAGVRPASVTC
jgi:hypothetical protein